MSQPNSYQYQIEQTDIDFTQRGSITSLMNYILASAGSDASKSSFAVEELNHKNCTWVLTRFAVEIYLRPQLYDTVTITTWISDCSRLSSTRNYEAVDQHGNRVMSAVSQWSIINLTSRSAINLTTLDIECCDRAVPIAMPHRIDTSACEPISSHTAGYSDIDFNRHVGTMSYIEMVLDTMPLDELESNLQLRFDLQFVRESRHGEHFTISRSACDSGHNYLIAQHDGTPSVKCMVSKLD